jgi:hypothetical protein
MAERSKFETGRRGARWGVLRIFLASWVIIGGSVAALVATGSVAGADAPTPTSIHATVTATPTHSGREIVTLTGTWKFTGEKCTTRKGVGWSVNWWGNGTSSGGPKTDFTLYTASLVTTTNTTGNGAGKKAGTISGAKYDLKIGTSSTYFYEGPDLSGYATNSKSSTCTNTGTDASKGPWTAKATYSSATKIPSKVCANFYDMHEFSSGTFTPSKNDDSTVQKGNFTATKDCVTIKATPTISTQVSSATVAVGTSVTDAATVTGATGYGTPTGKVTFRVCSTTASHKYCSTSGSVTSRAPLRLRMCPRPSASTASPRSTPAGRGTRPPRTTPRRATSTATSASQ